MEVLVLMEYMVINVFVLLDIQALNVKKVSIFYRNRIRCMEGKNSFYLSTPCHFYVSLLKFHFSSFKCCRSKSIASRVLLKAMGAYLLKARGTLQQKNYLVNITNKYY